MNTFEENLNSKLQLVEQMKDFVESSDTQRIRSKKRHVLDLGDIFALGSFGILSTLLLVVFQPISQSPALYCILWGVILSLIVYFGWSEVNEKKVTTKWKNKAHSLGLGLFDSLADPKEMDKGLSLSDSQKVGAIETCEKAGATPNQVQQLYNLINDQRIPVAWWKELDRNATEHYLAIQRQIAKEHEQQQAQQREQQAREKIEARMSVYVNVEEHSEIQPNGPVKQLKI